MGLMETGPGESGPAGELPPSGQRERVLELAAEAMRRYDFSPRATVEPFAVAPGHVALRIDDPVIDECAVLRLHRPGYHHISELRSEQLWLGALLAERVVDVPPPIAARTGERVVALDDPQDDGDRYVTVYGWLEGDALAGPLGARAGEAELEVLGAVAARLHAHAARWGLPAGFCRRPWGAARLLAPLDAPGPGDRADGSQAIDRESASLIARAEAQLRADLAAFPRTPDAYGLIHADLTPRNVLAAPGSAAPVYRVVDFDDCGPGWLTYDCAAAIDPLTPPRELPPLVAAWCAGYRSVRELSPQNAAQIPAFLVARALTAFRGLDPTMGSARASAVNATTEIADSFMNEGLV